MMRWKILFTAIAGISGCCAAAARADVPVFPKPAAGGPRPSVNLGAASGAPGNTISVSGSLSTSQTAVNVLLLIDENGDGQLDGTRSLGVIPVSGGTYAGNIILPDDLDELRPGALAIGVAAAGAVDAEIATQPFTLLARNAGTISGQIPQAATGSATISLYERGTNALVASQAIGSDGSFTITGVPAGDYRAAVSGDVSGFFDIDGFLHVDEGSSTTGIATFPADECLSAHAYVTKLGASPTASTSFLLAADILGYAPSSDSADFVFNTDSFGTYVADATGDPLPVTFYASLQTLGIALFSPTVQFSIENSAGHTVWGPVSDATSPYEATVPDIGAIGAAGTYYVRAGLVFSDGTECDGIRKQILLIPNPALEDLYHSAYCEWDDAHQVYNFAGWMPNFGGALHYEFPSGGFSVLGIDLSSGYDFGVQVEGSFNLNGVVGLSQCEAQGEVRVLGKNVWDDSEDLLPHEADAPSGSGTTAHYGYIGIEREILDPRDYVAQSDTFQLFYWYDDWTPYSGTLFTIAGIADVNASITLALAAWLNLATAVTPIEPELAATMTPGISPSIEISAWLDLVKGFLSGGATGKGTLSMQWPITAALDKNENLDIDLGTTCIGFSLDVRVWWSALWGLFHDDDAYENEWCWDKPSGCDCGSALAAATPWVPLPRTMAAPAIATGPGGRRIRAWIQDTSGGADPNNTLMASFWNTSSNAWEPAVALTTGEFAAADPQAAFVGNSGAVFVAFAMNSISRFATPPGLTLNQAIVQQEIYTAQFDPVTSAWTTVRHTTDASPNADGRVSIAADGAGATLAWTRDTDGDPDTREDWRIAVRSYRTTGGWGATQILTAAPAFTAAGITATPFNASPRVARNAGEVALAWVADADADYKTNAQRRVVYAVGTPVAGANVFTFSPQLVPGPDSAFWDIFGAEQPSLRIDAATDQIYLAFVVRGKDGDGVTDTGIGNNNQLFFAHGLSYGASWQVSAVRDGDDPVFAEKPEVVMVNAQPVVVLRRFGRSAQISSSDGEYPELAYGQLAYTLPNLTTGEVPAPRWITDTPFQHWQQSAAVTGDGARLLIVDVRRAVSLQLQPDDPLFDAHAPCQTVGQFGNDDIDPLEMRVLETGPDLEVNPTLELSQGHAGLGANVAVTARVRNVGMKATTFSLQRIEWHAGADGTGALLGQDDISGALAFGDERAITRSFLRQSGVQKISARIVTQGGQDVEVCGGNNLGWADLGAMPAPREIHVSASSTTPDAIEATVISPRDAVTGESAPGIAGFRLFRAANANGPFDLIGESIAPVFTDRSVQRGVTYYYRAQMYDAAGVIAPWSDVHSIALPAIQPRVWNLPIGGSWSSAANWSGGVPTRADDVHIDGVGTGTVTMTGSVSAGSLTLGSNAGVWTLRAAPSFALLRPSRIAAGGTLQLPGANLDLHEGWLENLGRVSVVPQVGAASRIDGRFANRATGVLELSARLELDHPFRNQGGIVPLAATPAPELFMRDSYLINDAAGVIAAADAPLVVTSNVQIENAGRIELGGGSMLRGRDATAPLDVRNSGVVELRAANGGQAAPQIALGANGVLRNFEPGRVYVAADAALQGGSLLNLGEVELDSGAMLTVSGAMTQYAPATLIVDVDSTGIGRMSVSGAARLDGALVVRLPVSYEPTDGVMRLITAQTVSGVFADVSVQNLPADIEMNVEYLSDGVQLSFHSASLLRGDMNCDGVLNNFDIDPFVRALVDPAGYQAAFPGCDMMHGDVNGDGAFNNFDIDRFVECIVNSGCP